MKENPDTVRQGTREQKSWPCGREAQETKVGVQVLLLALLPPWPRVSGRHHPPAFSLALLELIYSSSDNLIVSLTRAKCVLF